MTLASSQQLTDCREYHPHNQIDNPFEYRSKSCKSSLSLEDYVKSWIDKIFYSYAKIDAEAKLRLQLRFINNKPEQMSSFAPLYLIIIRKMKQICFQIRQFINHSYETLKRQSSSLSGNNDPLNSWNKNWRQFKSQSQPELLKNVNPTVSRLFVISYRYICDVSRQIRNLLKILYDCYQCEDIRFNPPQNAFNQLLIQVFTQPKDTFQPKLFLPTMSFPLKCKFIYAEMEGIAKREELCRFYEDQTVKKLVARKDLQIKNDDLSQEISQTNSQINKQGVANLFYKKYETLIHKNRLDHKDFEHIRTFYIENEVELVDQKGKKYTIIQRFSKDSHNTYPVPQNKLELIRSLSADKQIKFQVQDTSSQDDSQNDIDPFYYTANQNNREQLIEQGLIFQIDAVNNLQKHGDPKETEESSKVSSSQGNQLLHDSQDMPIKNYQVDVPVQFIYNQQAEDGLQLSNKDDKKKEDPSNQSELQFQLALQQNLKLSLQQSLREDISSKMTKLQLNITKSKQSIKYEKEKRVQKLDKSKLQEQKQKLQRYRKELQKQKEQLLKEVERFMKEKKRQENLLMIMKDTKARGRYHHNASLCKFQNINYKIIHKLEQHQQKLQSITLQYESQQQADRCQQQLNRLTEQDLIETQLMESAKKRSIGIFGAEAAKLSKKQQKLRKRVESQMKEGIEQKQKIQKRPKQEKIGLCQQQACLSNFLQQLHIDEFQRVACNIDQSRLVQWSQKINAIRTNKIQFSPRVDPTLASEAISKKKKKNRR